MPTDEQIESKIRKAFKKGDSQKVEEIVELNEDGYSEDLSEMAFRIAVQENVYEYVQDHVDEIDLNDLDDIESSYFQETQDPEMRELLINAGANVPIDDYDDYRLAIETVNSTIIAFKPDFQDEILKRILEVTNLSEEELADCILEHRDEECPEPLDRYTWDEIAEIMNLSVEDSKIKIEYYSWGDEISCWDLEDFLGCLGWTMEYEGTKTKHQYVGVMYL